VGVRENFRAGKVGRLRTHGQSRAWLVVGKLGWGTGIVEIIEMPLNQNKKGAKPKKKGKTGKHETKKRAQGGGRVNGEALLQDHSGTKLADGQEGSILEKGKH